MTAYKKIIIQLCLLMITAVLLHAQQPVKPVADKSVNFSFPEFKEVKFDNGFKIYLIPDKRQPFIAFRLLVGINSKDGFPGYLYSKIACEYLSGLLNSDIGHGKTLTSGAVFNTESNEEYFTVNCLSHNKRTDEIIKLLFSTILNTKIDKEAILEIIKSEQYKGKISNTDPEYLAEALAGRIFRGVRYSPAQMANELSLITPSDIENFLRQQFIPENVTMSVVGDYNDSLLTASVQTLVKKWQNVPETNSVKKPVDRLPLGVYFIPRPESVQSYIMFAAPASDAASSDYERLNILTDIAGSEMYSEMRETGNIAYSARGYITSYSHNNNIAFVTSVSTENTIKAINTTKAILRKMSESDIESGKINSAIEYAVNRHYMAFDRKELIATFIQDGIYFGLPKESIKNYSEYLKSIKPYDINQLAKKYLAPGNMYIVVVGNPAIKGELSKIGEVYEYSTDLYSKEGPDALLESTNLTPEKLIGKYVDAIGGNKLIKSVNTIYDSSDVTMTIGGTEFNGQNIVYRQAPDNYYSALDCGSINLKMWSDGIKVWIRSNSFTEELKPEDRQKVYLTTKMFAVIKLSEMGFNCRILGISNGMVLLEAEYGTGTKSIFYFDDEDYLLRKIETTEPEPNHLKIIELYNNYREFGGILLPVSIETRTPAYNINTTHNYFINLQLGQGIEFSPPRE